MHIQYVRIRAYGLGLREFSGLMARLGTEKPKGLGSRDSGFRDLGFRV